MIYASDALQKACKAAKIRGLFPGLVVIDTGQIH